MNFTKDKNKLFWIINSAGWLLLLILTLYLYYNERLSDYMAVIGVSITYVVGFLVSIGLRYLYRRINYVKWSIAYTAFVVLVISVIVTHIWYWVDVVVSIYFLYGVDKSMWLLPPSFLMAESKVLSLFPIIVTWSTFYFSYKLWLDWMEQKERAEKADLLAHKAQLQMLRYQLNPHFLFNALNSVRALIESNKETAKEVITELSEFLRYSLISKNVHNVPLKEEIEAIKHYFAIQKIRYEERLDVNFDIHPDADEFPVLSFLIHPVIENAVKYGMETSPMPLKINISARVEHNKLILDVSNTGRWVEKPSQLNLENSGTGTGLENVKARLENAFPGRHKFEIVSSGNFVHIIIEITQTHS
jgi:two-component system, LytTR family, sensor kinase